jgi:ubiquinone biosynthesis protein
MLVRLGTRRRLTVVLHPISGTRRLYGRYARYLQVIRIVIGKGLLHSAGDGPGTRGSRLGRSLAATFDEAGGLFVKLGQAMSAQPQLVTASVASELEEIGSPDEIFADFSADPVGAASIAQTHFARLKDGREVVGASRRAQHRNSRGARPAGRRAAAGAG